MLRTSNKMKANISAMTAPALILTIGSAGCNEKEGKKDIVNILQVVKSL